MFAFDDTPTRFYSRPFVNRVDGVFFCGKPVRNWGQIWNETLNFTNADTVRYRTQESQHAALSSACEGNNSLDTNEESDLHAATVLRQASFVLTCDRAVCVRSPLWLFSRGGSHKLWSVEVSLRVGHQVKWHVLTIMSRFCLFLLLCYTINVNWNARN